MSLRSVLMGVTPRCRRCAASSRRVPLQGGLCLDCVRSAVSEPLSRPGEGYQFAGLPRGERSFDDVVLLSGGKDSIYLAHMAQLAGRRILCLTIDNGFMTDQAFANAQQATWAMRSDFVFRYQWDLFQPRLREAFRQAPTAGSAMSVDFVDGSTTFELGRKLAREVGAATMMAGLTADQCEYLGVSGCSQVIDDVFCVYPLAHIQPTEEDLLSTCDYLGVKNLDSTQTNSRLVIPEIVIDYKVRGYLSFEPQLCAEIRKGKLSLAKWRTMFELLEYKVDRGQLDAKADDVLSELDLSLKGVLG